MRLRVFCAVVALSGCWSPAQTFEFKGPDGGDVRSLAISSHSPNILILGTTDGQIFRSEDSGEHWSRSAGLARGAVVDNLAFDPNVAGRVYAGVWDINSNSGGLFRSEDNGVTWMTVRIADGAISIRALAVAPSDSNVLLVGALDGVYRSLDAGRSWTLISGEERELVNIESVAVDPRNADVIYAGTWHLGAKTTNGGQTWTWIKQGMSDDSDLFSISIHPVQPNLVYASACSGIYKSTNGGHLWAKLKNGLPPEARRTRTIYLDPVSRDRVYAGTTQGLFLSEDAGISWKRISRQDLTINSVAVNPRDAGIVYLATDDAGVLKSEDGGRTFHPSNIGFSHRQIADLVADPNDPRRLYAAVLFDREYGGFFISDDRGRSWRQSNHGIQTGDADIYSILPSSRSDRIYLGTSNGIYVSQDEGQNWTKLAPPPGFKGTPSKVFRSQVFQLRFLAATEQKITAATMDGAFQGDLKTGRWSHVTLPDYNGAVPALLVDPESNSLFVASSSGLFISRDGGKTWRAGGEGLPMISIRSVERLPREGVLMVGTSYGLYRSVDDGLTWTRVTRGIPAIDISVLRKAGDGKSVYAGDFLQGNVFVSHDLGANWSALTQGMNSGVSTLLIDPQDELTLFLGSRSDGISSISLRPTANAAVAPSTVRMTGQAR